MALGIENISSRQEEPRLVQFNWTFFFIIVK